MKKILISLLIIALLIPMVTSCAMNSNESITNSTLSSELSSASQSASQTTGVTSNSEVVAGTEMILTEVSITTGETESEIYAGEELAKYLQQKGVTVKDGAFPITIYLLHW